MKIITRYAIINLIEIFDTTTREDRKVFEFHSCYDTKQEAEDALNEILNLLIRANEMGMMLSIIEVKSVVWSG